MTEGKLIKALEDKSYEHAFFACGDIDVLACPEPSEHLKKAFGKGEKDKSIVKLEDIKAVLAEAKADFGEVRQLGNGSYVFLEEVKAANAFRKWFGDE